jgi:hypothetical protein
MIVKGLGSRIATLTMVFKLGLEAQKHWRRLNGPELVRAPARKGTDSTDLEVDCVW